MAAIDQGGQLDARRPAEGADRIHRRARGAASVKNIVHDHDRAPVKRDRQMRRLHHRQFGALANIVPMHRDIDHAGLDRRLLEFAQ